jgi:uncharacterized membrane protein YhaH (DUF805 family)
MRDKSLSIWLTLLFGIPGIAVLMLAWLWPALVMDKIAASFVGSAGLSVALIQALMLKRSPGRTDNKQIPVKVGAEDKA